MFATSIMVDPLLTSPRRARNHDDDMAALQRLPALELDQKEEQEEQEEQEQEEDQEEEEQEEEDAFQRMMNRGNYLRQLRLLALEDERERLHAREKRATAAARDDFCEEKKEEDFDDDDDGDAPPPSSSAQGQEEDEPQEEPQEERVATLPDGRRVLDYSSYLAHQRYFDDLKHVDAHFIDYGPILRNFDSNNGIDADCGGCNGNSNNNNNNRLVVEQRKSLGKGGLCWDAAFVLGEHVIARESEWNNDDDVNATTADGTRRSSCSPPRPARRRRRRIVELGAGTGLCGMMLAKATECEVEVTDLPELVGLMEDNVRRNFRGGGPPPPTAAAAAADDDDEHPAPVARDGNNTARGTVSARTLRWGAEADYGAVPYDVIVGADIVTSLYDAVALARTLHALSGPDTRIYISGKARLDRPHMEFDEAMNELFDTVERIERPVSRLRSNVFIIVARGRR